MCIRDRDSEGLLLLTNQGDLVNEIMKAGNFHEKEYLVTVDRPVTEDFLQKIRSGVPILGTVTRPCVCLLYTSCRCIGKIKFKRITMRKSL